MSYWEVLKRERYTVCTIRKIPTCLLDDGEERDPLAYATRAISIRQRKRTTEEIWMGEKRELLK